MPLPPRPVVKTSVFSVGVSRDTGETLEVPEAMFPWRVLASLETQEKGIREERPGIGDAWIGARGESHGSLPAPPRP